jgi:hypothetical protein
VLIRTEPQVASPQKAEWIIIKELVDRRTFWWSELFLSLEEALPPDVRVVSVTPHVSQDDYLVDLTARVRDIEAGLAFVQVLEDRPEFEGVYPRTYTGGDDSIEYMYSMRFLTAARRRAIAAEGGAP